MRAHALRIVLAIGCGSLLAAYAAAPHRMVVPDFASAKSARPAPQAALLEFPDAACDDGNPCTRDAGDPETGCSHEPISCDDGIPCTRDLCVPPSNWGCVHIPDDALCADELAWNGVETCSTDAGCRPGPKGGRVPATAMTVD